jgi:hypothetical protein
VPDFKQFCTLISAVFHFEYLDKLEHLKDRFAPFDPDSETRLLQDPGRDEREAMLGPLFDDFIHLMERANFKRLSWQDIQDAMEGGASDWGINMYVDPNVFERIEVFARGDGQSIRIKRGKIFFWKKEVKKVDSYQRLVLMMKLRKHKLLGPHIDTGKVFLKLFKDIPKLDLEMVLPGARIQMPRAQKGKLGASLLGTFGFAIYKVWTDILLAVKVLAQGALVTAGHIFWGPFLLIAGYGYKQYAGYQITKQTYSKMLTESLYFQTLDNNSGVMTRLLDEAEEQECREAILAWFCLWRYAPPEGWTDGMLDDYVEMYLEQHARLKVDFEIGDALEKVERLGIVQKNGDRWRAVPLEIALEKLDYRWDNYFQYNKAGAQYV